MIRTLCIVLLLFTAHARAQECVLSRSDQSFEVRVKPRGAPAFTTQVRHQPARMTFRAGRPTTAAVDGILAFQGTVAHLDVAMTKAHATSDGMLFLREGADLLDLHFDGKALIGTLFMAPGECDGDPFEHLETVRIPCDAATPGTSPEPERYAYWWRAKPGTKRVVLYAEPRAQAAKRVLSFGERDLAGFRELERRGSWLRVKRAGHNADLVGWLPMHMLERASLGDFASSGYGCSDGSYRGRATPQSTAPQFEGVAEIAAGTVVYYAPARGPWATVPRKARFEVRHILSEPWATIVVAPGLGGLHAHIPAHAYTPLARH